MGKNQRQKGEETPSHPGGLSEVARKRLEERRRERMKGELFSFIVYNMFQLHFPLSFADWLLR
jgi:hypothetical protein